MYDEFGALWNENNDSRQAWITVDKIKIIKKLKKPSEERLISYEITASEPTICVREVQIISDNCKNLAADYAKVRLSLIEGWIRHHIFNTANCQYAKIGAMVCWQLSMSAFAFSWFVDNENTRIDTSPNMQWLTFINLKRISEVINVNTLLCMFMF